MNPTLELRVRLFNVLAIGGALISLIMAGLGALNNSGPWNVIINLIVAYHKPDFVKHFLTEREILTDIIIGFTSVSAVIGVCLYIHFRLYNEQQKKLDEQNAILAQANRAKTEFLANASHEMRTPLTVISVNVQTVSRILNRMGGAVDDPDAAALLADAQSEIMRLARMVGGMLSLAFISESAEKSKTDLSALLCGAADMLRLLLQRRGNELHAEIDEGLSVFCDADLLSQVVINLIQNAHAHTENGAIRLRAHRNGAAIVVSVGDNSSGIDPGLLPHVFERGVSAGGTGYGLFLCKNAVESHGGEIRIESAPGQGTTVRFTLPVYEGQYEGYAL